MKTAICSACGGTGELLVHDERHPDDAPTRHQCNICEGKGMVGVEDNDDVLQTDSAPDYERRMLAAYSTPGLQRVELAPAAKRDHLKSLRLDDAQIAATMLALYPPAIKVTVDPNPAMPFCL